VFDYLNFKFGLLVCYDVEFSEMVRLLGLRAVEVVLAPVVVSKAASSELLDCLIPGHAIENRVHIAYVNYCGGGNFNGNSKVFDSGGLKLVDLGEDDEGIFTCKVVKNKLLANHLRDRRSELYKSWKIRFIDCCVYFCFVFIACFEVSSFTIDIRHKTGLEAHYVCECR